MKIGDKMAKQKKRKLKKNVKTLLIFLLCCFLITITILYTINNKPLKTKPKSIKTDTSLEIKLKKLKNINEKISYFDNKKIDRYIAYQNENKDLDIKQIILNVNMGLDNPYYTNTTPTKNLNTPTILVNKYNYLTEDYIPDNLENISTNYAREGMKLVNYAKDAFEELAQAAQKENMKIIAMSSYRSYTYQVNLYNRYVAQDGKEAADTYSARAGFSEHQTGLAADVYNGKEDYTNFEKTKEFTWMQENAHKYGFILRFPKDKVKETGYQYESWHYRYVGKEAAKYIHKHKITLEEYYVKKIEKY